jgi:N-acetylneuraminic acid mutarotase
LSDADRALASGLAPKLRRVAGGARLNAKIFSEDLRMMGTMPRSLTGLRCGSRSGWDTFNAFAAFLCCGLAFAGTAVQARAQATAPDEWTWMGGSSSVSIGGYGEPGVYGTLGVPAAANIPGGRGNSVSWTDKSGNAWLFGGAGRDANSYLGYLNDLWEFNVSTDQWTWVGGSSSEGTTNCSYYGECGQGGVYGTLGTSAAGNVPGGRSYASGWVDGSGNLWLFGGEGYDATGGYDFLNELWEFNTTINQWAWMGGSNSIPRGGSNCEYGFCGAPGVYGTMGTPAAGNVPGSRATFATWTDANGNLWLFGGGGYDANGNLESLNDLWEFSTSTNEWTWVGGSSVGSVAGVYGTLGKPGAENFPGGRSPAANWTDSSGNLWLFGGVTLDANGVQGLLNDLWMFNPSSKEWTWMGGSNTAGTVNCGYAGICGPAGVYGTLGVPAAGNVPGGNTGRTTWVDGKGNFWFFGGNGLDSTGTFGSLNDLWEFNLSSNQWTWMGGSSTVGSANGGQSGIYGTLGVPSPGNIPGGRTGSAGWTDNSGNLWLAGGNGFGSNGLNDELNDVWEYEPPAPAAPAITSAAAVTLTSGIAGSFTVTTNAYPVATLSETGALPNGVTFTNNGNGTATLAGTPTASGIFHITITANNGVSPNATQNFTLTVNAPGAVMTSPKPGSTVTGPSVTFTWTAVSGVTNYQLWLGASGVGSSSLFNSGATTATSATATNIPANGATIYARLYSEIGGKWQWVDYTYIESGTAAVLTSPKAGSTFTGANETFTWTAGGGVTNYQLWVGTSGVGSSSLYNSGPITTTSVIASLPQNGQTVYARLYSKIAGVWQFHDYTFTEEGTPAVLTSPRIGSTLAASNVTFTWNSGEGVTDYELWLGTSGAGSGNLYNSGAITTTSVTVPTLQANGVTLYARLYSETGGVWSYHDYAFVEAGTPGVMVSPAQGSTLGSSDVIFSWTAGAGNTNYQLWLGLSGVGSSNLYNSGSITTTSTTVPSLPVKGATVYARLYSESGGVWSYHDYTYTEQ